MQNVVKTNHRPIAKVGDDSYTFIVQRTRTTEILSKHFFFFFFSAYEQWMRMDSPYRDKVHCSRTVYVLFMGPMTLFIYLKIILL